MMVKGTNANKTQLRIAISKTKTSALESGDREGTQLLDIMETLTKVSYSDAACTPNENESELTTYRRVVMVLDDILDGTMLKIKDVETICRASKAIGKDHEKLFGATIPLNAGFGRRIGMILSTKNVKLSSSEWKRSRTPIAKCLQQQSKNIRMNRAILPYLLALPIDQDDADNVFTVGMEWTGPIGYMSAVKTFEYAYSTVRCLYSLHLSL
ncbi:hypothetical protein [Absidia glauca]|uniref:Uncharacterized protein n=1 Tax=Absidia glauca TaxID=4829 RepID=A0A168R363_ABSGL|nr:hypothetical protein [Absidia glauca]